MLREISSVFVAFYVVILLLQLHALRGGPEAYQGFQDWLKNPLLVILNGISLLFVLFHAVDLVQLDSQCDGGPLARQTAPQRAGGRSQLRGLAGGFRAGRFFLLTRQG